jgi:hypothetical protein
VRELTHGTLREKAKFLLVDKFRGGDKAWEDILFERGDETRDAEDGEGDVRNVIIRYSLAPSDP